MDSWKLCVPNDCHSLIKCHYMLKRFARGCKLNYIANNMYQNELYLLLYIFISGFSLDADIVACANTGYLLEFKRKCVIGTCDLSDSDAESVTPFLLYNPVKLFYVVKFPNKLIIVLREEKLKVTCQFC